MLAEHDAACEFSGRFADELAAAAREDGRTTDQAGPVLLVVVG